MSPDVGPCRPAFRWPFPVFRMSRPGYGVPRSLRAGSWSELAVEEADFGVDPLHGTRRTAAFGAPSGRQTVPLERSHGYSNVFDL